MDAEVITSRQNPILQHVKKLLASRSYREQCGQYAADGTKLLQEALRWDAGVQTVLLTKDDPSFPIPDGIRKIRIPEDVMRSVSQMEAPQGALFVCKLPEKRPVSAVPGCLILDGLQDPGNVGTVLRTADALEIPVILADGCADAYNPKTVRASMGAVFRTPPQCAATQELIGVLREKQIPILVTALSERAKDLRTASLQGAVVIGSEGRGVGQAFLSAASEELVIPMNPRCESLNAAAAAAIVMWEMKNR